MSALLDRMKAIMEREGIKPKQLTAELGISNSSFTDWSKGKGSPSVNVLTKFASYFNVSLDYLILGEERTTTILESSNPVDRELIEKFHSLPLEYKYQFIGYVDGVLSVIQKSSEDDKISV